MSKADGLENALLDLVLSGAAYTPPATVYVALYTAPPTDAGGGTEVATGSYARVAVTNNATNWPAAVNGVKRNGTPVIFPIPSADWGILPYFGLHSHITNDALMYWGTITPARSVLTGNAPTFGVGNLVISEQ